MSDNNNASPEVLDVSLVPTHELEASRLAAVVPVPVQPAGSEVGQLIRLALERDMDVDKLERLFGLYERDQANKARAEFYAAKSAFLADCPPVQRKSVNAQFSVTRAGTKQPAKYASLDDIQGTIDPVLAKHGLSYRWGSAAIEGDLITQECILTHIAGHCEVASVTIPHTSSAGCSPAQKFASASTYARRYSLIAVIGVRGCDEDHDGNGEGGNGGGAKLSEQQVAKVEDALSQLDPDRRAKFLAWQKVKAVADIPAAQWDAVDAQLRKVLSRKEGA